MILSKSKSSVDINDDYAILNFSKFFKQYVTLNLEDNHKNIIFLCIGTDRSTGDSLGPLIGYKLLNSSFHNIMVHGTLEEPVHAKNLSEKVNDIYRVYENPFIIAIDACLGHQENVGKINIASGPIYPGAGVNKNLMPVGNINITGIVNTSGYMEYFVLQNTRLSLIMKMADIIANGIIYSMEDIYKKIADAECHSRHSLNTL